MSQYKTVDAVDQKGHNFTQSPIHSQARENTAIDNIRVNMGLM